MPRQPGPIIPANIFLLQYSKAVTCYLCKNTVYIFTLQHSKDCVITYYTTASITMLIVKESFYQTVDILGISVKLNVQLSHGNFIFNVSKICFLNFKMCHSFKKVHDTFKSPVNVYLDKSFHFLNMFLKMEFFFSKLNYYTMSTYICLKKRPELNIL